MSGVAKIENSKEFIIEIRRQRVLLDSDVAQIYGAETRDINKAVTNNPDKFPEGYIIELTRSDRGELVENFHRLDKLKHSSVNPKAFVGKGLYMLATILKSPQATQATISMAETFPKVRELSLNIKKLSVVQCKTEQKSLMQKSRELIVEIFDEDLQTRRHGYFNRTKLRGSEVQTHNQEVK